jgi:hypothetical protein
MRETRLELLLAAAPAAGRARQFTFEARHIAFKLIDALSENEHVVACRIVDAFQGFGEAHNLDP